MADRKVVVFNETEKRLETPLSGDRVVSPQDVQVPNLTATGSITLGGVARSQWGTVIDSGTSSGGNTATTLNDTTKDWGTSGLEGSEVKITGGTGAGQVRRIVSHTATQLTVADAWTTTPDATSTYEIYGVGNQTLTQVLDVTTDRGALGNIDSPLVRLPLRRAEEITGTSAAAGAQYSGTATFTRASTATYIDPLDGLLKTAAIDMPRFERMADGGIGLLVEGSSTNLCLQSETFDDATKWTYNGLDATAPIVANSVAAPDGNTTADGMKEDTANTWKSVGQGGIAATNGETITFSVYIKAGSQSWAGLTINDNGMYLHTTFDVANGAIGSVASGVTARITSAANGFYRCQVTYTITSNLAAVLVYAFTSSTPGAYTGTGATALYLWGAQVEKLPFASSYIQTTSAAVTRAADGFAITNNIAHSAAQTIMVDYAAIGGASTVGTEEIVKFNGDSVRLYRSTGAANTALRVRWQDGANPSLITNYFLDAAVHRLGVRYDGAQVALYADGVQQGIATPSALTGIPTSMVVGNNCYGHIRNLRIYDRALTDAEMAAA